MHFIAILFETHAYVTSDLSEISHVFGDIFVFKIKRNINFTLN